jgi:hypothetical protein
MGVVEEEFSPALEESTALWGEVGGVSSFLREGFGCQDEMWAACRRKRGEREVTNLFLVLFLLDLFILRLLLLRLRQPVSFPLVGKVIVRLTIGDSLLLLFLLRWRERVSSQKSGGEKREWGRTSSSTDGARARG